MFEEVAENLQPQPADGAPFLRYILVEGVVLHQMRQLVHTLHYRRENASHLGVLIDEYQR